MTLLVSHQNWIKPKKEPDSFQQIEPEKFNQCFFDEIFDYIGRMKLSI